MNTFEFILDMMRQNYESLGFIPDTRIQQYIQDRQVILQERRGHEIGYLIHGKHVAGHTLSIAQAVIDYDYRESGHGMDLVHQLIQRAQLSRKLRRH